MTKPTYVLRDVTILDGTGTPGFRGDVRIQDGEIAEVGSAGPANGATVIQGEGRVLCPGFIDVHSHLDFTLFDNPGCLNLVAQGITLAVGGNCGFSAGPTGENMARYQQRRGRGGRRGSLGEWFREVESTGVGLNVASYVGEGNLRGDVMGVDSQAAPSDADIARMADILRGALDDGAFGLSTGRDYVPGCYSEAADIARLAAELGRHPGAFYVSHLLDESEGLVEATREALEIGRSAGVPTLLSHHKAVVPTNRGLTEKSLALVDEALRAGEDARLDVYPYDFSATIHLFDMLPARLTQQGKEETLRVLADDAEFAPFARDLHAGYPGWTSALADFDWGYTVLASPGYPEVKGMTVGEIAHLWGLDPAEVVRRMVLSDGGTSVCSLTMAEEDVTRVITHPRAAVCTDSAAMDTPESNFRTSVHPRSYGTYPRFFARYVREREILSLEEAVHRCTGLPASWLDLSDRGVLRPGARADLVLFDPATIQDTATLDEPTGSPRGIDLVLVDGVPVIAEGRPTGERPGAIVRRGD